MSGRGLSRHAGESLKNLGGLISTLIGIGAIAYYHDTYYANKLPAPTGTSSLPENIRNIFVTRNPPKQAKQRFDKLDLTVMAGVTIISGYFIHKTFKQSLETWKHERREQRRQEHERKHLFTLV